MRGYPSVKSADLLTVPNLDGNTSGLSSFTTTGNNLSVMGQSAARPGFNVRKNKLGSSTLAKVLV